MVRRATGHGRPGVGNGVGRISPEIVLRLVAELVQRRSVPDPTAAQNETWRDVRTGTQAAAALFTVAVAEGEVVAEVTRPMRLPARDLTPGANAENRLSGVWLSVINRDDELIQRLCAVRLDTLRASGAEHDRSRGHARAVRCGHGTASTVRVLDQHRQFWGRNEQVAAEPDGFLALAPLAVAVLARSVGTPVDVESEYLPKSFPLGIRPSA